MRHDVGGQRLRVLDDLYDSAATLEEVTRVLMATGAEAVCVLTVTRAIHSGASAVQTGSLPYTASAPLPGCANVLQCDTKSRTPAKAWTRPQGPKASSEGWGREG